MQAQTLFLSLTLVCLVSANPFDEQEKKHGRQRQLESARASFKLPKLFNFDLFKHLFKKTYDSLIEEIFRRRLFLARAFDVFLSVINYKHRLTSSYMAINQMSDWTLDELHKTHTNLKRSESRTSTIVHLAEIENIEPRFHEIVERAKHEPGFKEVSEVLNELPRLRSSAPHSRTRNLPLEKLGQEKIVTDRMNISSIESNNPEYREPELPTFGLTRRDKVGVTLDLGQLSDLMVRGSRGSSIYISSMLKAASNYFASPRPDERQKADLGQIDDSQSDLKEEENSSVDVDHRDSGCVFGARNQGQCGSCYAFASIALYEWHYCNLTGKRVPFSEQYLVDCGFRVDKLWGCKGGHAEKVSEFVNAYGLELRSHYPYEMRENQCPYDSSTPAKEMGFLRVHDDGFYPVVLDQFEYYLQLSPLVLNIHVNNRFYLYGGGVDSPLDCVKDFVHLVLLVGSGREDGESYWLIRNSYGTQWGLEGYYKMSKKATDCVHLKTGGRLKNFSV